MGSSKKALPDAIRKSGQYNMQRYRKHDKIVSEPRNFNFTEECSYCGRNKNPAKMLCPTCGAVDLDSFEATRERMKTMRAHRGKGSNDIELGV